MSEDRRHLGQWKGRVRMSDDFDAPACDSDSDRVKALEAYVRELKKAIGDACMLIGSLPENAPDRRWVFRAEKALDVLELHLPDDERFINTRRCTECDRPVRPPIDPRAVAPCPARRLPPSGLQCTLSRGHDGQHRGDTGTATVYWLTEAEHRCIEEDGGVGT